MAKNLPGLVIKIGANTKDAIDGLNKVNRAVGKSATGGERLRASWAKAGPAIAAAGVAVGALAIKLGSDAVAAAKEEEVSVGRLAQTLKNLGMATADTGIEKFIDDMQFSTGIADNDLRPAMDRLVRSTGDVGEAQRALSMAADIAVAKQRNVVDVANILGKAYDGNTMALGRLGVGLDKSVLKSGDMAKITSELSRLFSGQAAAAADTLAGRTAILKISIDELSESFGNGLIRGFAGDMENAGKPTEELAHKLRDLQPEIDTIGAAFGSFGAGIITVVSGIINAWQGLVLQAAYAAEDISIKFGRSWLDLMDKLGVVGDTEADLERQQYALRDSANKAAYEQGLLSIFIDKTAVAAEVAADATAHLTTAGEADTRQMERRKTAADRLKASLDKLNGNRSIMRQRINLAQMLEKGPQGTGKDGKVTRRDRRLFALDVADARAQLGEDIFNRGGKGARGAARQQFRLGRANIRGLGFGEGFAQDLLATPAALLPGVGARPGTPQSGRQVATVNYNFYGGITVDSSAAAQQAAKQATRLAALSGRYAGKSIPVG